MGLLPICLSQVEIRTWSTDKVRPNQTSRFSNWGETKRL